MSNNRSSGGYFSKDASKLVYSSDKTGVFNIYEVDLTTKKEIQKTNSEKESYFVQGYSPLTNEIIYSADKGGNENSHLYLISCLLYTSPSPRDGQISRMPSSA